MSDITAEEIDPKRPWIVDAADAPASMNWMQTLFNPFGETSRLHFTRAWTMLFFIRFIYAVGAAVLVGIFTAAGADDPSGMMPPAGTFHIIVIVTALMSLVAHVRRLANAQRSPLWAVLVMVPVLFGFGGFIMGVGGAGHQYTVAAQAAELRAQGMPDREIVYELDLAKRPSDTPAEADANADKSDKPESGQEAAAASGPGHGHHMDPRQLIPQIEVSEVSQREHALKGGIAMAQMTWALPAFLVMLWTLFWVGRLPNGGGSIKGRLRSEPTSYEEQV